MDSNEVKELNLKFKSSTPMQILEYFIERYRGEIALSTSLSMEDQILTKMVCDLDKDMKIFTLDTGRLFPETYDLIDKTSKYFDKNIDIFFPNSSSVEMMVRSHSINLFYDSVENRKLCCKIRKMEPLGRAFTGLKVWVCGLRQEQSITRYGLNPVEVDPGTGIIKISPLYNWTLDDVKNYIANHSIPYNPLFEKGFSSIGCQPCTRAIEAGEEERSGRWWWESPETKECGLHKMGSKN